MIQFTISISDSQIVNGVEYTQSQLQQGLAQVRTQYNQRTGENLSDAEWLQWSYLQNLSAWYEQGKQVEPVPPSPIIPVADRPNWSGFIVAMDEFFAIGLNANYVVFTQLFNMLLALRDKHLAADDSNIEWRNFVFNWQIGKDAFSASQLEEIQAKMAEFGLPVI